MHGVRNALVGIGVIVAACRGNIGAPPAPAPKWTDQDAVDVAIGVSTTVGAPIARLVTQRPAAPTPPPAIEAPPPIAPPIDDDTLEPADHDERLVTGARDAPAEVELDDRLGVDGLAQPARGHRRRYGLAFDVGLPDGATAALVISPVRSLAVSAGLSYNGISYGGRAGVTWTPLAGTISPTLSADVGHFAEGDANPLVQLVTGKPMFSSPVLDRVGYDYADAHIGIAITRRSFALFVRAGVSRVTGAIHDLDALAGGKMVMFGSDPTVTLTTVSARLGVIYYFAK